ncbi:PD-(D/E)XK nuclease family protein [Pontibacter sp. HSC-36F09]|uniref:PD-(D/E)XK nuclease family protein n=1 Tax=Pontibacter sp. HSC-36F09 TaxID=2910966 RepID=UPI0020A04CF4|nr:PD-(D/E)XK nuclease family protein [Pontibacter sp. HSC-36F09]
MLSDYTKLLIAFKAIPQPKRVRTLMEISGYPHYENVCSNILKFYLNPNEEHNLGDLVLNSLIHLIDEDFRFDLDFEEIEVIRELRTINDKRLDILVLTNNYAIGIENKIFHHLHNDLADYSKTVNSYCYNTRKPVCIVLSLNKLTSPVDQNLILKNHFINITYDQLFQNIKKNIGSYLRSNNSVYVHHLTDFIRTLENLTNKTMEDRALLTFFRNNSEAVQELTDKFIEYTNSIYKKVNELNNILPSNEFAPSVHRQWIWDGRREGQKKVALVHDFKISDTYHIAIDTCVDINGWEIQLFGRNHQSDDYLYNTMCNDNDFLPKALDNYERNGRLIFDKFNIEVEISTVAQSLSELLNRIEDYKKRAEERSMITPAEVQ